MNRELSPDSNFYFLKMVSTSWSVVVVIAACWTVVSSSPITYQRFTHKKTVEEIPCETIDKYTVDVSLSWRKYPISNPIVVPWKWTGRTHSQFRACSPLLHTRNVRPSHKTCAKEQTNDNLGCVALSPIQSPAKPRQPSTMHSLCR